LYFVTNLFGIFEWGQNISDRLSFTQISEVDDSVKLETIQLENGKKCPKLTWDLYKFFKIDSSEIIELEEYFLEYFIRLLKRLRDINFEDVQKQRNLVL